jgi:uncharacterized Tic20 family protein
MEVITPEKRSDPNLLVLTHLSQLLTYGTGFGGLIVPLVLWLSQRDRVVGMDEHGKAIVNFQLSLLLYAFISIPAILLVGLGVLMLIAIAILGFVMPIVNAIKANKGEPICYFMTIKFIN